MDTGREALNIAGSVIAGAMIALLGLTLWALVFRQVPLNNRDALMVVIGILSMNVGTIINFFFGSSVANKKLAETVNVQAKTAATAGAALGSPDSMVIPLDTTATVTPTDAGAEIHKEPT